MEAWILYVWITSGAATVNLTVVDQIATKEACEVLLSEIKQSQPVQFAYRGGACKPYRIVQK
jgi:hypothetical protein